MKEDDKGDADRAFSSKTINISIALTDFCPEKPPAFKMRPPPPRREVKAKQRRSTCDWQQDRDMTGFLHLNPWKCRPINQRVWESVDTTVFRNNSPPDYSVQRNH